MNLEAFMIEEKEEIHEYIATEKFKDSEGKPIPWKIKTLTAKENDEIRKQCYKQVQVGKKLKSEFDSPKYLLMVAERCVVFPNLKSQELQDYYHVMGVEDLLKEHLLKLPGEYDDFTKELQRLNGYEIEEAVEEAKN